jgi:hypothetical protein
VATPIEEVVNVTISLQSIQLDRAGYGLPLILSDDTVTGDLISEYSSAQAMTSAGYATSHPTYLMASILFSQSPRPKTILVGRRTLKPTRRWAITPVVTNSTRYRMTVNDDDEAVDYTSDASATAAEIIAGLKTDIDALSLGVTTSDQTTYLRIVENTPGAWHQLSVSNTKLLKVAVDHADPGIATDLAAIQAVRNEWYTLLIPTPSSAEIAAAAAWIEAAKKLLIVQSQDSDIINTVASGATDIAATLKAAAYARTAVIYSGDNSNFADAGWAGKVLPTDAGSEQWAYKTLAGVTADVLDDTQYANAMAKNANVYVTIAGVNLTTKGKTASGEFIDVTRGSDAFRTDIQENVLLALIAGNKQAMDDGGIQAVVAAIKGSQSRFEDRKFLRAGQQTVTAPLADDISDADRSARILPDVVANNKLAGAILTVDLTVTITP